MEINRLNTVFVVIRNAEQDGSDEIDSIWSNVEVAGYRWKSKGKDGINYRVDEWVIDDPRM